jgi:hypothetical protein
MSSMKRDKLRMAAVGVVACGSALLLLLLGLRGTRRDSESTGRGRDSEAVRTLPRQGGAQAGQSASVAAVGNDLSQSGVVGAAAQTNVDAASPAAADMRDLEELAEREIARSSTRALVHIEIQDTQRAQDQVMAGWPEYEEMRELLLAELSQKYSLADLSVDDLVESVVALREQFWKAGGNLSASAWRPGYQARGLAEIAAERAPENSTVIDELVETLQSLMPLFRHHQGSNRRFVDRELWQTLEDLRHRQFEQARREIAAGRQPTLRDFVRGADLLYLVQDMPPNTQQSTEVVRYLKVMCQESGWSKFLPTLDHIESTIEKQGCGYGFNIYAPQNAQFPDEYGYHRRLPSFRGPAERNMKLLEELQ